MIPKTLEKIARDYDLTAHMLRFKMIGARGGFVKGYSLVNSDNYEQLEIEPVQRYGAKEKYLVRSWADSSTFYVKSLAEIGKRLRDRDWKPKSRTGVRFKR